jgi:hypothetical protein
LVVRHWQGSGEYTSPRRQGCVTDGRWVRSSHFVSPPFRGWLCFAIFNCGPMTFGGRALQQLHRVKNCTGVARQTPSHRWVRSWDFRVSRAAVVSRILWRWVRFVKTAFPS